MKRFFLICFFITIGINIFAQKFEVIKELPFGNPIEYYEESDPNEGMTAGICSLNIKNNYFYINDSSNYEWKSLQDLNDRFNIDNRYCFRATKCNELSYIYGGIEKGYGINVLIKSTSLKKPDYRITLQENLVDLFYGLYITENKLFAQTENELIVYWELLPEGKTVFHNAEQTKNEMEEGLAEHLGITDDDGIYFGETCITTNYPPNYKYYWNNVKILTEKYNNIGSIGTFLGTDKKGISYFYKFINSANEKRPINNPDLPITVLISALDSWTHEAEVISLPAGDWNPPRNENGLIAVCSQCIDEEGNIYFTDCNKEKGCYEIKKLSNDWIKKYDFYKREVGRMNANHIPLQTAAKSSAENNGYNFDHEYLWILEHGEEWCKVRKVDGREGWVETKYINFDDGKNKSSSVKSNTSIKTNVSVNRIMRATDNLRLRKEEATSSAIITTMQKGTMVKILKLGKAETIDGISSNWVQIEVQSGAKDRDGKPITPGTTGWCYGGYLE